MKKSPRPLVAPLHPIDNPLVREILGGDLVASFALLDICSEECERAGVLRTMPSTMFRLLAPSDIFAAVDQRTYRAHVRELLGRYKAGKPLDEGTAAEVLLGMVETSLAAPLTQGGAALYHAMFREVLGPEVYADYLADAPPPRERYAGQLAELEREARRKVRSGRPRKVTS